MQSSPLLLSLVVLALTIPAAAQERASVAPKNMQQIAPALAKYTDDVLFGDVWVRPELSPRDRSVVTLAVMISTGKGPMLTGHVNRALTNGLKPGEIAGILTHLALYSGWPNVVSSLDAVEKVFTERGIAMPLSATDGAPRRGTGTPRSPNAQMAALAPKFEELTANVLYNDLWLRTDINPRDRSLVTIAAQAANGDETQLASHIGRGMANGLKRSEIIEALTHVAFYAGWAKANSAIRVAGTVFDGEASSKNAPPAVEPRLVVFPAGQQPTASPATNFTGSVTATSRFKSTGRTSPIGGATVTFQPGARTNWHTHPLGQLLIVTTGHGWVQAEGEPVRAIGPGDVIWTAPGTRHWHGATRTSSMTHVGVTEALDGETVTWAEPVTDAQYRGPK